MNIKQFNKVIVILTLVVGVLSAADAEQVPGRFLVGVRDAATASRTLAVHNAKVRRDFRGLSAIAIEVPPQSAGAALESLRQSGSFDYVEPDYYAHTAADPNDPSYGSQWHLRRIGGPLAWSLSTGSDSVVVAIVDSGVYPHHPDLASKLVPGWNFVKDNADTADVLGHGTAVAGTVAAQTNNGLGVAGVTWAGRIMPLVAVDAQDYAAYSDIAAAIQYAADHGVRVINVSIGGFELLHHVAEGRRLRVEQRRARFCVGDERRDLRALLPRRLRSRGRGRRDGCQRPAGELLEFRELDYSRRARHRHSLHSRRRRVQFLEWDVVRIAHRRRGRGSRAVRQSTTHQRGGSLDPEKYGRTRRNGAGRLHWMGTRERLSRGTRCGTAETLSPAACSYPHRQGFALTLSPSLRRALGTPASDGGFRVRAPNC